VYNFRKPVPKETTPTNTDTESPPTPTKPSRQTRARNGKVLPIQQPPSQASDSDNDAEEVASELASQWFTPEAVPPAPSSDDFGGYSDDE